MRLVWNSCGSFKDRENIDRDRARKTKSKQPNKPTRNVRNDRCPLYDRYSYGRGASVDGFVLFT